MSQPISITPPYGKEHGSAVIQIQMLLVHFYDIKRVPCEAQLHLLHSSTSYERADLKCLVNIYHVAQGEPAHVSWANKLLAGY